MDKYDCDKKIILFKRQRHALTRHKRSAERAIRTKQKALIVTEDHPFLVIEGQFYLFEEAKPFDSFNVKIMIPPNFPKAEPVVVEVGDRIQPRNGDRHINENGTCCFGVWELWRHFETEQTVEHFLNGIVHNYFVQQVGFELDGKWPIGELPHYEIGLFEAYATILGFGSVNQKKIRRYLDVLSLDWPKGHVKCPCGSKKIIRICCKDKLNDLHLKISPHFARRMRARLPIKAKKILK